MHDNIVKASITKAIADFCDIWDKNVFAISIPPTPVHANEYQRIYCPFPDMV